MQQLQFFINLLSLAEKQKKLTLTTGSSRLKVYLSQKS